MITKKILKLFGEKYGSSYFIIIFTDGSGRITDDFQHPYSSIPAFLFSSMQELIDHLKGE